jgi:hypothetical protein
MCLCKTTNLFFSQERLINMAGRTLLRNRQKKKKIPSKKNPNISVI